MLLISEFIPWDGSFSDSLSSEWQTIISDYYEEKDDVLDCYLNEFNSTEKDLLRDGLFNKNTF